MFYYCCNFLYILPFKLVVTFLKLRTIKIFLERREIKKENKAKGFHTQNKSISNLKPPKIKSVITNLERDK